MTNYVSLPYEIALKLCSLYKLDSSILLQLTASVVYHSRLQAGDPDTSCTFHGSGSGTACTQHHEDNVDTTRKKM
jgi:hypothetical protein